MARLPKPTSVPLAEAETKQVVQANPVRFAKAALNQPGLDTLGRGDPDSAAPSQ